MIIGIAGRINSGKDTISLCIEHLTSLNRHIPFNEWLDSEYNSPNCNEFKKVRFADKLKDIVCILIGCTRSQLEDREFKEKLLGEKWIRYGYADGFTKDQDGKVTMNFKDCTKEEYEIQRRINWQTAYKHEYSPRQLLQYIGTDLFRKQLHPNVWVNATMVDYKAEYKNNPFYNDKGIYDVTEDDEAVNPPMYPKWVIPDVRFPNEVDAIKNVEGITIKVERLFYEYVTLENKHIWYDTEDGTSNLISVNAEHYSKEESKKLFITKCLSQHESETALDDYEFDYVISNDGTIEDLYHSIENILIDAKIITPIM
jgi:hypothetical protein